MMTLSLLRRSSNVYVQGLIDGLAYYIQVFNSVQPVFIYCFIITGLQGATVLVTHTPKNLPSAASRAVRRLKKII